MSESEDDAPQLSAHTLAALQEFYAEQLQTERTCESAEDPSKAHVEEDWVKQMENHNIHN